MPWRYGPRHQSTIVVDVVYTYVWTRRCLRVIAVMTVVIFAMAVLFGGGMCDGG
jgi:hypothetical protein